MSEIDEPPNPWISKRPTPHIFSSYCAICDDLLAAHETAHHDFVSCHIKVHAAAPGEPPTWTQALKDYLEMMAPRRDYPFHFTRRDDRGELLLGRARGPDLGQILRVDGPHAAPAMHYDKYGSVLVVGAGGQIHMAAQAAPFAVGCMATARRLICARALLLRLRVARVVPWAGWLRGAQRCDARKGVAASAAQALGMHQMLKVVHKVAARHAEDEVMRAARRERTRADT